MTKLRVAFLAGTLGQGGAEKQLIYMAHALFLYGADVRVFSLTNGEHHETTLRSLGIPLLWIGKHSNPILRLITLINSLRKFKPHIIQSAHFYTNLYISIGRLIGKNLAIGCIRGDTRSSILANGIWGKILLKAPPTIISNSFTAAETAQKIRRGPIETLPNVIDINDFDRNRRSKKFNTRDGADKLIAVYVARLIKSKCADDFLQAIALAKKKGILLSGKVIGDGPERQNLETLAFKLELLSDGVSFLGWCDDIPAVLSDADLLVHTSLHEGFPNVLLEGMAASLPIITTPAGDSGRVVEDGITGYIIPFKDPNALSKKMIHLAQKPQLRRKMGNAGRVRVEQKFSFDKLHPNMIAIYTKIAQNSGNKKVLCALQ